jgi:hypothetical protein
MYKHNGKPLWVQYVKNPHNLCCGWEDWHRHKVNILIAFIKEAFPTAAAEFSMSAWWKQAEAQAAKELAQYQEQENHLARNYRNSRHSQEEFNLPQESCRNNSQAASTSLTFPINPQDWSHDQCIKAIKDGQRDTATPSFKEQWWKYVLEEHRDSKSPNSRSKLSHRDND